MRGYILAGALATSCVASNLMAGTPLKSLEMFKNDIRGVRQLPAHRFNVIQSGEQLLIVSADGHYAIVGGRVVDAWNAMEIKTLEDVDASRKVPLKKLNIPLESLGAVRMGAGPRVYVFMDPMIEGRAVTLAAARAIAKSAEVVLILIPATDDHAGAVGDIVCLGNDKALEFLESDQARAPRGDCGADPILKNIAASMVLGISEVPMLVAANGAMSKTVSEWEQFSKDNSVQATASDSTAVADQEKGANK